MLYVGRAPQVRYLPSGDANSPLSRAFWNNVKEAAGKGNRTQLTEVLLQALCVCVYVCVCMCVCVCACVCVCVWMQCSPYHATHVQAQSEATDPQEQAFLQRVAQREGVWDYRVGGLDWSMGQCATGNMQRWDYEYCR